MANLNRIEAKSRRAVPYAPWSQFKQFLDKMKVLSPRVIDPEYLRSNQMGGQQPGPLFATIQFLDLVDGDNLPTSKLDKLKVRGEQQYAAALYEVIKDGYSDLFDAVNVEEADRDTIYNQIRSVYQCSTRVANTATPLFLALAFEAGMNVAMPPQRAATPADRNARSSSRTTPRGDTDSGSGSTTGTRRRMPVDSRSDNSKKGDNSESFDESGSPSVHVNLQIHIDAAASPDQIDGIFAAMARHLYRNKGSESE